MACRSASATARPAISAKEGRSSLRGLPFALVTSVSLRPSADTQLAGQRALHDRPPTERLLSAKRKKRPGLLRKPGVGRGHYGERTRVRRGETEQVIESGERGLPHFRRESGSAQL